LKQTLLVPQPGDSVELDEVWSFVRRKKQQVWVWLAVAYQSRQVRAMVVGDRSAKTCRKLWERLPEAYQRLTSYTDFYLHRLLSGVSGGNPSRGTSSVQEGQRLDQHGGAVQPDA